MRLSILVWDGGENNPFEYVADQFSTNFKAEGHEVAIHHLPNSAKVSDTVSFVKGLLKFKPSLVIAFQGLGLNLKLSSNYENIWEEFQLKLICLHGDHPSHNPNNHKMESKWVKNIYSKRSHAQFFNDYFFPSRPAGYLSPRGFFVAAEGFARNASDQFFVLPKNFDDPSSEKRKLFGEPTHEQPQKVSVLYSEAEILVNEDIKLYGFSDHHQRLNEVLESHIGFLKNGLLVEPKYRDFFFAMHALFDKFYRNKIAERVLEECEHIPLLVAGRGWSRFSNQNNPNHRFIEGKNMQESEGFFTSAYGVLDVGPSFDGLHDRTLRAIFNATPFTMVSNWGEIFAPNQKGLSLFSSAKPGELEKKLTWVMKNSEEHYEQAVSFSKWYRETHTLAELLAHFDDV